MKVRSAQNETAGWRPARSEVNAFLKAQPLCVISTLDVDGAPQSATVAFSVTQDGRCIIGTHEASRKSSNIDHDARVAVNVTDPEKRHTVQLEGRAQKMDANMFAEYADTHFEQLPASRPFKDQPGQVHIMITPTHIRFSDCSTYPWEVSEFTNDEI